jgi:hypothetical protein
VEDGRLEVALLVEERREVVLSADQEQEQLKGCSRMMRMPRLLILSDDQAHQEQD